jgi:hypothetical protein
MSRRYATLDSLMTGRGGVHEVDASRLVPIAVAALDGVEHVRSNNDGEGDDEGGGDEGGDDDGGGDAVVGVEAFASHVEYQLPGGDDDDSCNHLRRSLHVLRLTPRWARRLRAELVPRARDNARRGHEALERLVAGKEGGVVVSNVGGYQSAHDLLEPATWSDSSDEDDDDDAEENDEQKNDEENNEAKKAAASGEDVGEDKGVEGEGEGGGGRRARVKGWGVLSSVVCAAHERMRAPARGERAITHADLYGWLNSNGAGDYNKLHDHGGAESWSGVYYMQCPEPVKQPSSDSDDSDSEADDDDDEYGVGALGLRCHEPTAAAATTAAAEEGGVATAAAAAAAAPAAGVSTAVPYLRFRPRAGDLVGRCTLTPPDPQLKRRLVSNPYP